MRDLSGSRWTWVVALLALCAVGLQGLSAPRTVTWLHIWGAGVEREQITRSIALFEAANPDIKVEEIILDAATWQPKLLQLLSGDSPPDVFLWYPGPKTWDLVNLGVIAPITEVWDGYGLDDLIPLGLKAEVTYQGEQWNLPWGYHPTVVYYNKRLFDRLGLSVPTTIREFEAVCDAIKAAGVYPLVSGASGRWRTAYPVELLVGSLAGPEFYDGLTSMKISWDNAVMRAVYEIWQRWVGKAFWYPDILARKWSESLSLLLNSEGAMLILGTYGTPLLEAAGWRLGEDFDAFLFPHENPTVPLTLTGPFDTWCMAAKAPHPEEAQRLLAFLATVEPQTMRAIYHGGLACNRYVTSYNKIGVMVRDAINSGAIFHQVMGNAIPPAPCQAIVREAMADFYYEPDIEEFVRRCEAARAEYWAEQGQR